MEGAIQTLVKVFLKSAKGKESLGQKQFQSLVTSQLSNILSGTDSKEAIANMGQGLDSNHDGKVGFNEYMKLVGYLAVSLSEQRSVCKDDQVQHSNDAAGQVAKSTPNKAEEKPEVNAEAKEGAKPEVKEEAKPEAAASEKVEANAVAIKVEPAATAAAGAAAGAASAATAAVEKAATGAAEAASAAASTATAAVEKAATGAAEAASAAASTATAAVEKAATAAAGAVNAATAAAENTATAAVKAAAEAVSSAEVVVQEEGKPEETVKVEEVADKVAAAVKDEVEKKTEEATS